MADVVSMNAGNRVMHHTKGMDLNYTRSDDLEQWRRDSGLDWTITESPVIFQRPDGFYRMPDRKVLFRSDNGTPLSVVSKQFKVVQPREIIDFFADLVRDAGFEMTSAGCLKEGRKIYGLAKVNQEFKVRGVDPIRGYLLLATACDGSLMTTAGFQSLRLFCTNQLAYATSGKLLKEKVKVNHRSTFDATQVKIDLGLANSAWSEFTALADQMAQYKMDLKGAELFVRDILGDPEKKMDEQPDSFARTLRLFEHDGKGHDCPSADHTLWGAVNAVTEYLDHHRKSRSEDNRLDSIWFGEAARVKNRTFEAARILLAA